MSGYQIKLLPSNQTFEIKKDEIILDAAIRQGVYISYSCRNGTCRTCLFEIKEGAIQQEYADYCLISDQELAVGKRLICMSTCQSDVIMEKA
ncbi:hypothetical protein EHS13_26415 [Paenibacillus psychroresistens]|uniref:2Fe-2S ferredoxin-type domain-containing protein n=1 Tax=Paenibacillus psychroresistens TaxID=1778678 RepID=A0A6B8RQP4_9BACL|nr:2Fe-2S iron-sulfur cluster-binding protein [Paenibacillus psychroresistens]QGQ98167.1 hypothetical protein EHS13_26415 [Paenibacillus psychroresistens]